MKELICIVCPKGCHLKVDEENGCAVTGNGCPRGAEYGKNELLHPARAHQHRKGGRRPSPAPAGKDQRAYPQGPAV